MIFVNQYGEPIDPQAIWPEAMVYWDRDVAPHMPADLSALSTILIFMSRTERSIFVVFRRLAYKEQMLHIARYLVSAQKWKTSLDGDWHDVFGWDNDSISPQV